MDETSSWYEKRKGKIRADLRFEEWIKDDFEEELQELPECSIGEAA
ncbi:MAG: hypothetical protein QXM75_00805 [Candidatus Diapherotrites archaeon]